MENNTIRVNAEYSSDLATARRWIEELSTKSLIACDFEAAVKYSPEEIELLKRIRDAATTDFLEKKFAESVLSATALDHPAHVKVTHFSVAWSDSDSYVIIMDSEEVTDLVMEFLVTTTVRQIWHNASYDFKLLYYATGKFPKNFEDSQVFAKTIFNHVDTFKAKVGLKELAGAVYGAWGIVEDDFFTLENMYDPRMLHYAATDSCATFWVFSKLVESFQAPDAVYPTTMEDYTPWEQLPAVNPCGAVYPEAHFYHYTAKWLIPDTVRIMMNGLPISLDRVKLLEERLIKILAGVQERLDSNPSIVRFLAYRQELALEKYIKAQRSKMRTPNFYDAKFDSKKVPHRCFFMDVFAEKVGLPLPDEKLPQGCSKWSVKLIRNLKSKYPPLNALLTHTIPPENPTAKAAMVRLAEGAANRFNAKYYEDIKAPKLKKLKFNAASPKQKQELFAFLGCVSDKVSKKTGADSWDREQIEQLLKVSVDEDILALAECLIDHSFSAIVKNNFVAAFYKYTLEGSLYGQYKLLGAKSGRYTSSNPNMLNTPSSRSIFAKPVKECLHAPKGFVIGAIDYAALEDRVMGNLSGDENKKGVFTEGLDGHSLAATYYFRPEVSALIGDYTDNKKAAKEFDLLVAEKNPLAVAIRGKGKPVSFGLAYGAFPPKVAASVKIPLSEATTLFEAYHGELYPGVTRYREEYVLKTALDQGFIHLGLGFRMYTDNPHNDIRTLNNGTCQFWSILTTLAINRIHYLIDRNGYSDDIFVTSTIYDSIYFVIRDNPETIKWLNDELIPIMEKDFMVDQDVPNSADLEIGPNWASLYTLPHNASIEDITKVRGQWP